MPKEIDMPGLTVVDPKPRIVVTVSEHDRVIEAKFVSLGGAAKLGQTKDKEIGKVWHFKNGSCICYNKETNKAYEIHGAIYQKWVKLGGRKFGIPCTDETGTPDGL